MMVCRSEVCNMEGDITISVRNSLLVNKLHKLYVCLPSRCDVGSV
jgi:hypothetical protein